MHIRRKKKPACLRLNINSILFVLLFLFNFTIILL